MANNGMQPLPMTAFIGGKKYATASAALLANGAHEGGPPWIPTDKVSFLFRTKDGSYFVQHRGLPERERGRHTDRSYWVEPLTELDAIILYWELEEHNAAYDDAFPPPEGNSSLSP